MDFNSPAVLRIGSLCAESVSQSNQSTESPAESPAGKFSLTFFALGDLNSISGG